MWLCERTRQVCVLMFWSEGALVVKLKTHHDRRHQCFIPQMESMLTEAESYVQHLSMAIFLQNTGDICRNCSLTDCTHNKQATIFQHCRHAAIDQRAFVYTTASKSFHRDSVAYAPNKTHRRASAPNDELPHKRKLTQTNGEWLVGAWWGRTEIIVTILYVFAFFRKRCLFPLDKSNHTGHPVCHHFCACGKFRKLQILDYHTQHQRELQGQQHTIPPALSSLVFFFHALQRKEH